MRTSVSRVFFQQRQLRVVPPLLAVITFGLRQQLGRVFVGTFADSLDDLGVQRLPCSFSWRRPCLGCALGGAHVGVISSPSHSLG